MKKLDLPSGFFLSSVEQRHKEALAEHLQERAISRNTLSLPSPYTESDAEAWKRIRHREEQPAETIFAVRAPEGRSSGQWAPAASTWSLPHRTSIGYWLARPYWNQGIMTEAVGQFVAMPSRNWRSCALQRRCSQGTRPPSGSCRRSDLCGKAGFDVIARRRAPWWSCSTSAYCKNTSRTMVD